MDDDVFSEDEEVCDVMQGIAGNSSPPRAPSPPPRDHHQSHQYLHQRQHHHHRSPSPKQQSQVGLWLFLRGQTWSLQTVLILDETIFNHSLKVWRLAKSEMFKMNSSNFHITKNSSVLFLIVDTSTCLLVWLLYSHTYFQFPSFLVFLNSLSVTQSGLVIFFITCDCVVTFWIYLFPEATVGKMALVLRQCPGNAGKIAAL